MSQVTRQRLSIPSGLRIDIKEKLRKFRGVQLPYFSNRTTSRNSFPRFKGLYGIHNFRTVQIKYLITRRRYIIPLPLEGFREILVYGLELLMRAEEVAFWGPNANRVTAGLRGNSPDNAVNRT